MGRVIRRENECVGQRVMRMAMDQRKKGRPKRTRRDRVREAVGAREDAQG